MNRRRDHGLVEIQGVGGGAVLDIAQIRRDPLPIEGRGDPGGDLAGLTVVAKRRRLFRWKSVRIHLDEVEGLGHFIELEAVAPPDSDLSHERDLVDQLRRDLSVKDVDLVAESYGDLAVALDES